MKKLKQQFVLTAGCCFYFIPLSAQNLIPNPGAELYTTCPTVPQDYAFLISWTCYGSTDFYHECSDSASPTNNPIGWQQAHNDSGVIGTYAFHQSIPESREFATNTMIQPLISGVNYCAKFFVSLADSVKRGIDSYGMLISDSLLTQYPLQVYTPQIKNATGNIMSDRTIWYEISGVYAAQGGEQYIHLGNFNNDANTNVQTLPGGGTNMAFNWNNAYFYLDDISIEEIKNAAAGLDQQILYGDSIQIGLNQTEVAQYTWSPSAGLNNTNIANPMAAPTQTTTYTVTKNQCGVITTDEVTVTVSGELIIPSLLQPGQIWTIARLQPNTKVRVYDAGGRLIFNRSNYQNDLIADHFSPGIYIYQIFTPTGEKQAGKLVIAR